MKDNASMANREPARLLVLAAVLGLVVVAELRGQTTPASPLHMFQQERLEVNRTAMLVLGGWAIGNIASGTVGTLRTRGEAKYVHQFNALWNTVNLGIAAFGLAQACGQDPALMSSAEILRDHSSLRGFLLLNAGLDVAYIATGLYLREKAGTASQAERLRGYGTSLLVQGGFLLAFDIALFVIHERLAAVGLYPVLEPLLGHGFTVGVRVHL